MTKQADVLQKPVKTILFSFTQTELNVLRLIGNHWSKMFVCHEIDRGGIAGETFMFVWSPEYTVMKLKDQPSFRSDSLENEPYKVGEPLAQCNWPLCRWELEMLARMVKAAVTGELDKFLLTEKGVMRDVIGPQFTQSWTCNGSAMALANKLDLLQDIAGMFYGNSSYQFAMNHIKRTFRGMDGVEALTDA